ncbi:hypothetical protein SAFG77S_04715 [Streptomyces afghaniensis]
MLHGAHEGMLRPVERGAAIGERHQVGDRVRAGGVGDDDELDPDLPLRVVQPEPAGLGQLRSGRATAVPRTGRQPGGEQFQLGRFDRGAVDDGHAEGVLPSVVPTRGRRRPRAH